MTSRDDFWSRRRAGVAREESEARKEDAAAREEQARAGFESLDDHEILEKLGLPDPETLEPGADFSAFMRHAVPERLRRRALRALWRSNPVLANVDNLVDYGGDFTDAAMVVESLSTTYQVGKGMLEHVNTLAARTEAKEEEEEEEGADDSTAAPEPPAAAPELTAAGGTDEEIDAPLTSELNGPDGPNNPTEKGEEWDQGGQAPVRRRMRFQYLD